MQDLNPEALFIHCIAYHLNLVIQDSLTNITEVSDFVGTVKGLIYYFRSGLTTTINYI